eukprot:1158245-Pelagomonas_calceolata.AAC.4
MRKLIPSKLSVAATSTVVLFCSIICFASVQKTQPLLVLTLGLLMLFGIVAQGTTGALKQHFKRATLPAHKHWSRPSSARNTHVSMAALRYPTPIKLEPKGTATGAVIFLHGLGGKLCARNGLLPGKATVLGVFPHHTFNSTRLWCARVLSKQLLSSIVGTHLCPYLQLKFVVIARSIICFTIQTLPAAGLTSGHSYRQTSSTRGLSSPLHPCGPSR